MHRLKYYMPPILWMAVIFILSTSYFSETTTGPMFARILALFWSGLTARDLVVINHIVRKSAHVVVYGTLALLWFRALMVGAGYGRRKAMLVVLLIVLAVAATDEFHQSFERYRTAKPSDVALDTCAAALALLTFGPKDKKRRPK